MRLLLTVGYYHLLFGKDANVTGILSALEGACIVDSKGYGSDKKYVIQNKPDDGEFQITLIQNDSITLPENDNRQLKLIVEMNEEKSKAITEKYQMANELESAKKKIEKLEAEIEKLSPQETKE